MKDNTSNIWIGGKDLNLDPEFIENAQQEFVETSVIEDLGNDEVAESLKANRRDFLKFLGFGLGAATVAAGCDIPVKKALPYVVKPESIVPGIATYYASTYVSGGDSCPILVKTREGRPIKIEGNDLSPLTGGGTSARAQASVLSLYDTARLTMPQSKTGNDWNKSSWVDIDKVIKVAVANGGARIVTNTVLSPSLKTAMKAFSDSKGGSIVTYDPVSSSAMLDANEQTFGDRVIPHYRFDKADVIVSFGADFLGSWISPVEFASQWAKGRKIDDVIHPKMSRHIQVESGMSMTGSNADNRILIKPSEQGAAIAYLASKIIGGLNVPTLNSAAKSGLDKIAAELKGARGNSLVVSNSNNVSEQILINAINNALGNIGTTVNFNGASLQRQGSEKEMLALIADINTGKVNTLIFNECNPVYDFAEGSALATAISKVKTKVAISQRIDETSDLCDIIAPPHHNLESWGDVETHRGQLSLIQPTIKNLFDSRQAGESFLTWADSSSLNKSAEQPYLEFVKSNWKNNQFANQSVFASFSSFWDGILYDGIAKGNSVSNASDFTGDISAAAARITKPSNSELEINFFESVTLGNGQFSNNPWLLETPDPVTRTSWGNYLAVPVNFNGVSKFIGYNDLEDGDLVDITIGEKTMTVPVVQQFGQMPGTVSLALGAGKTYGISDGVGVNVNDVLTKGADGSTQYFNTNVSLSKSKGKEKYFSSVQYHNTMGVKAKENGTGDVINADEAATVFFDYFTGIKGFQGSLTDRSIIYTSTVADLKTNVEELKHKREHAQHLNAQQIYRGHDELYEMGHHWGMNVDLNACIGCNACTVACMAENNVPVVGKKEVSRHHEMTWLRIDRYYYGDAKNPNTVYQPMMCQHCDNAPCENVCPVNATNHSSEGLNQMTYNRCVGTRYCANNCPYKVRRFNWYDYTTADLFPANQINVANEEVPYGADNLTRMVLNPDVTVRTRGVIEKCSFCVQRLQSGKLTAKIEGRRLKDSDVKSACMTACPTGAITFGDMNIKDGDLMKKNNSPLSYLVLEEINVRPSVTYTMKVNNRDTSFDV
ncbi:MAG: TAT-variant-translocated molybdopterin oxidoreductase [Saprospiraceae bacterium]